MKKQKLLLIGFVSLIFSIYLETISLTATSTAIPVCSVAELELLQSMPASILARTRGERPNADGLLGGNQTGTFVADLQRRAMDLMEVGIALRNDTDVADAWRAVEATYQRQTAAGDFGTGTNGNAAYSMHFWLAWSNHAILLLKGSSYGPVYASRIAPTQDREGHGFSHAADK